MINMTTQIRATPALRGKEANEFLKKMREKETAPITQKTINLAKRLDSFKI